MFFGVFRSCCSFKTSGVRRHAGPLEPRSWGRRSSCSGRRTSSGTFRRQKLRECLLERHDFTLWGREGRVNVVQLKDVDTFMKCRQSLAWSCHPVANHLFHCSSKRGCERKCRRRWLVTTGLFSGFQAVNTHGDSAWQGGKEVSPLSTNPLASGCKAAYALRGHLTLYSSSFTPLVS